MNRIVIHIEEGNIQNIFSEEALPDDTVFYIVSEILDGIDQLGEVRYGFPTHYLSAWQPLLTENRWSGDIILTNLSQSVTIRDPVTHK